MPYIPWALYSLNMMSRSGTPVVGITVYVHFRPETTRELMFNMYISICAWHWRGWGNWEWEGG